MTRLLPILLLVLLALPAGTDLAPTSGSRWWETIAAPVDHGAGEVAPSNGVAGPLRLVRSGDGPAAGDAGSPPEDAVSRTWSRTGSDPLLLAMAAPLAVRPHAERLPYHATAPPVRA